MMIDMVYYIRSSNLFWNRSHWEKEEPISFLLLEILKQLMKLKFKILDQRIGNEFATPKYQTTTITETNYW